MKVIHNLSILISAVGVEFSLSLSNWMSVVACICFVRNFFLSVS